MERPGGQNPQAKGARTVLVAGAGGFLGKAITAALVAEGHRVRGLVRDPTKSDLVRRAGGQPMVGDVLEPSTLRAAMEGCDSVVHVAAQYPGPGIPPEMPRRVRVEGVRNLADAARAAGANRLLVCSGYWVYAGQPGVLVDDSPLDPRGESLVNYEAEQAGLEAATPGQLDVVVVRPAMVYGEGSWFRVMVNSIRSGSYLYPHPGTNLWSMVELSDAARAFVTLLERGRSGEAYLVVDDAPIMIRDLTALVAREFHLHPPAGVQREILEHAVGPEVAYHLAANRAGSNQKLRGLGWVPRYGDCRKRIPAVLDSLA